jgi:hypothetical protein
MRETETVLSVIRDHPKTITGEPITGKLVRRVREGADGKGPVLRAPHRRPTSLGGGPLEKGLHCRHLASGLPDPKARDKTKLRPLGIPVIMDRCHQARVRHALEPEWL